MKKKLTMLFISIFFAIGNLFAFVNTFKLSEYKLPELKRQALIIDFNLSTKNRNTEDINYEQEKEKIRKNSFNSDFEINYNKFINTPLKQQELNLSLKSNSSVTFVKSDYDEDDYHRKQLLFNIISNFKLNNIHRFYILPNKFIETDYDFSYEFNRNYNKTKVVDEDEDFTFQSNYVPTTNAVEGTLFLKTGSGRIDEVQDAVHAIYIFNELAKQDRIQEIKDKSKIMEFAEFISKLKNKRFFDSRIRRIYEITAIDSFLTSKNYVKKSDAKYFTTLSDIWEYSNIPVRKSGQRFSIMLAPKGYYYHFKDDETKIEYPSLNFSTGLEWTYQNPINLYWQRSFLVSAIGGINNGKIYIDDSKDGFKVNMPYIALQSSYGMGFYPDTRTEINFYLSSNYMQVFKSSAKEVLLIEGNAFKIASDISLHYYISPKIRINIASNVSYMLQGDKNKNIYITFENPNSEIVSSFNPYIYEEQPRKSFNYGLEFNLSYEIF